MTEAHAGAFGLREQSAEFQGESFAGDAAGGALSSMFWNPAAAAARDGINVESTYDFLLPHSSVEATGGPLDTGIPAGAIKPGSPPFPALGSSGGSYGGNAFVPASYANYQLNDRWYVGLALNSPGGFGVKPENTWAGSPFVETAKVRAIDINPNIAYKVTPELTIGAGLQVEYFHIYGRNGALPAPYAGFLTYPYGLSATVLPGRSVNAEDWGVGAKAGAIWKPTGTTTLGVGYTSAIDNQATGTCTGRATTSVAGSGGCVPSQNQSIHHDFTSPQSVSVSLRQDLTERLTVLATVEWTNWSVQKPGYYYNSAGQPVDSLPVSFNDGWFYAIGAEYKYGPLWTFRTGLSYEKSPVDDANRTLFLPDSDRWTPSVGASYKWSDRLTVNFAYSHIFLANAPIVVASGGATLLTADAKVDVDVLTIGLKYNIAGPSTLEPFK